MFYLSPLKVSLFEIFPHLVFATVNSSFLFGEKKKLRGSAIVLPLMVMYKEGVKFTTAEGSPK